MKTLLFILCSLIAAPVIGSHEPITSEEICDQISGLGTMIKARYGSAWCKEEEFNWNLEEELHKAKVRLLQDKHPSLITVRETLTELFRSMQDYHVKIRFFSTEGATLPFKVQAINGKLFITDIDQTKYPSGQPKLAVGDEVIRFGGRSAKEALDEVLQVIKRGAEETDLALACQDLTERWASSGFVVPQGKIDLVVRSRTTQKENKIQFKWNYSPELINEPPLAMTAKTEDSSPFRILNRSFLEERYALPTWKDPLSIGDRESFLPKLGKVVWECDKDSFADAYIFLAPTGEKIGYLRIPHYMGGEEEMQELEAVIQRFQKETQAIVLDQLNNPGGSVFFCFGVLSLLTDRPLVNLVETMVLSQEEVYEAHLAIAEFDRYKNEIKKDFDKNGPITALGYYMDWEVFQGYIESERFVTKQWKQNKFLTDPIATLGQEYIKPHPKVRYTKPILVLINELDFSCGDILPAVLQDNHRATLIGVRTAGAGGYVRAYRTPNRLAIRILTLTGSIGYRADGSILENAGVTPDISLKVTEKDLYDRYSDYTQSIQNALKNLLRK